MGTHEASLGEVPPSTYMPCSVFVYSLSPIPNIAGISVLVVCPGPSYTFTQFAGGGQGWPLTFPEKRANPIWYGDGRNRCLKDMSAANPVCWHEIPHLLRSGSNEAASTLALRTDQTQTPTARHMIRFSRPVTSAL